MASWFRASCQLSRAPSGSPELAEASAQTALSVAAKVPNAQRPAWLVGFKASFTLRHGVAKQVFEPERYTWFEWAKP